MSERTMDLSQVFALEPHGADTFVGASPPYGWGRVYGGLVVAQALWAATCTVRPEHVVHSLHAYFVLAGKLDEPIRYEVEEIRNGRSFSTRRVVARQCEGAILTLACSFQGAEIGAETQSARFPDEVPPPDGLPLRTDAGAERRDVPTTGAPPGSRVWVRYPLALGDDATLHACGLAYLSDVNAVSAVRASHPLGKESGRLVVASLDHAVWFHRPTRADDWLLIDNVGHGIIGTRGLATGQVFTRDGVHVATVAQEALMRIRDPALGQGSDD